MLPATPRLSIIIVNFNTRDWLLPCLESLEKQALFPELEIIVVENGSSDNAANLVREKFPACKLIRLEDTVGFGHANNLGAQHATAPILLFLNPDTLVEKNALVELLHLLEENPHYEVAGGLIHDGDGNLERSTGSFPTFTRIGLDFLLKHISFLREPLGRFCQQHWTGYGRARRVDWVTAAYIWIRRNRFESFGGFDQNIYMYCEDVDLCYRAGRAGAQCWFFPLSPIVHFRNKSPVPRSRKKMLYESRCYFAGKYYQSTRFWLTRLFFKILAAQ